jgi:hypothetical protein
VIESHQHHADGWCHGVGVMPNGVPFALIEYPSGQFETLLLDGVYHMTLKEWPD